MNKFLAGFILFLIIVLSWFVPTWNSADPRHPTSLTSGKLDSLRQPLAKSRFLKPHQGIVATIELNEKPLQFFSSTQKLIGRVEILEPMENVKIYWQLPEGATLVSGQMEVELNNPDSLVELPIEVRLPDNQNRQIHLQVDAKNGDTQLGTVAQHNTQWSPPKTIQAEVSEQDSEMSQKAPPRLIQ